MKSAVLAYLYALPRSWWFKVSIAVFARAGIPDIIGCYRGLFVAIELKAPHRKNHKDGGVSPIQKFIIEKIAAAGGIVFVAYGLEDVRYVLGREEPEPEHAACLNRSHSASRRAQ